jgi:hypothetical protein
MQNQNKGDANRISKWGQTKANQHAILNYARDMDG